MKLEVKYLAPYLPFELKVKTSNGWDTMLTLTDGLINGDCEQYYEFNEIKPILRPLSDLTKEIEVNGEKFVPAIKYEIIENCKGDFAFYLSITESWALWAVVEVLQDLFKHHFDVFGLIDKGLAIDINTHTP